MIGSKIVRTVGVLTVAMVVWAGCAKRESAEVTTQRTEMTTEHQAWNTDLANWEAQDAQLRVTMTAPPAGGGTTDTTGLSDRMARLTAHEANIAAFKQSLSDLERRMQDEKEDHAALYAEHQRLKAQYDMLRQEQDGLAMGTTGGMSTTDTTATY